MTKFSAVLAPESSPPRAAAAAEADRLATAIRRPAEVLDAAAAAAASGMLGGAKLGLLVAAAGLCDALKAVDAEFARRYPDGSGTDDGPPAARPDRDHPADERSPLSGMRIQDGSG